MRTPHSPLLDALVLAALLPAAGLAQAPAKLEPPSFFTWATSSAARQLKTAFEAGHAKAFLETYNANAHDLAAKAPKLDYWYFKIAADYNAQVQKRFARLCQSGNDLMGLGEMPESSWAPGREVAGQLRQLSDEYNHFQLLRDPRFRSPAADAMEAYQKRLLAFFHENQEDAFQAYLDGDCRQAFCSVYPGLASSAEPEMLGRHARLLQERAARLAGLGADPLLPALGKCMAKDWLVEYIELAAKLNPRNLFWTDFQTLLADLHQQGADPALLEQLMAKYVMFYRNTDPAATATEFPFQFDGVAFRDLDLAKPAAARFPADARDKFVVVVAGVATKATDQQVGRRTVASTFISEYHMEPNPAYAAAEWDVRFTEGNYNTAVQSNTNNQNGGGLLVALSAANLAIAQVAMQNAQSRLQSTPAEIEVPTLDKYSFNVSMTTIHRQEDLTLYFWQPGCQSWFKSQVRDGSDQSFQVADGIRASDPKANAIQAGLQTEADLANEHAAPVVFNRENLIGLLASGEWYAMTPQEAPGLKLASN
ncbi:MAG: hypothetical protein P4L36_18175 [Holophaga sp.]|nr:hypothetical protein [Holophaga sp.]